MPAPEPAPPVEAFAPTAPAPPPPAASKEEALDAPPMKPCPAVGAPPVPLPLEAPPPEPPPPATGWVNIELPVTPDIRSTDPDMSAALADFTETIDLKDLEKLIGISLSGEDFKNTYDKNPQLLLNAGRVIMNASTDYAMMFGAKGVIISSREDEINEALVGPQNEITKYQEEYVQTFRKLDLVDKKIDGYKLDTGKYKVYNLDLLDSVSGDTFSDISDNYQFNTKNILLDYLSDFRR